MKKLKTLIVVMLTIKMLAPQLVGAKDQTSPADLGQPSVKKLTLEPETSKATETQKEKQTSKERETQKEKKKKLITSPAIQKYEMFKRDYEFDKDNAIEAFWGDVTDEELVEILKYMDKKGEEDKQRELTGSDSFWEEGEQVMKKLEELPEEEAHAELEKLNPEINKKMEIINKRFDRINTILYGKNGIKERGWGGGNGGGNSFSYADLEDDDIVKGDIVFGDQSGGEIYGEITHVGIYDGEASWYNTTVILSALPDNGVLKENTEDWSRYYDYVYISTVKGLTDEEKAEAYYTVAAVADIGEKYSVLASKEETDAWYCSKIPWYGYKNASNSVDLDMDGGPKVTPEDIFANKNKIKHIRIFN